MSGRNRWFLWLAALLAALLLGGGALAMEPDPRSFAMGGAYTAVVNDATAVFWNPAALGEVKWAGAQLGLGGWADDLEQANKLNATYEQGGTAPPEFKVSGGFGAGLNLALLNHVGLGINGSLDLQAQNRLAETVYGTTISLVTLGSQLRGEGAVGLAFQVAKPPLNLGALAVGGVIKYLAIGEGQIKQELKTDSNNAITEYKTTAIASQATGFGLDLGVQAKLTDVLVVGLKVRDLVSQASG
ncbi:MAG: hypothetical protein QJR13_01875, partial [Bacillota bacterium]|nr:hypothetical protein [Bacillota bacterium]